MPIELEQPPSDASVQSAEGKISINFNQLNNTIIDGETVPISAIIQSLPEDCRSWGRDYIDKEQQARHELIKIEQRNQFELEKTDKQKEIEELRLSHKSEQFGKICGLICTALFKDIPPPAPVAWQSSRRALPCWWQPRRRATMRQCRRLLYGGLSVPLLQ